MGLSVEPSAAELEASASLIDGLAKDFMAVGKRKDYGWTQDVNARFASDVIASEDWTALGKVGQAVFLTKISNASAFRQYLEKKGVVAKKADGWE